jgi:tetratricopeptide (TPR) repeat protein
MPEVLGTRNRRAEPVAVARRYPHRYSLLLTEGSGEEAASEFRVLLTRNAASRVWRQAGSFLLGFEQYQLAREFLLRAKDEIPAANLDLAIAVFFLESPAAALTTLEQVPEKERSGDYLLLKAQILDVAGRGAEAEKVLDQGRQLSISRPSLARQAALLLVRHDRKDAALELLSNASGNDPDLLLTRSIVLALMDRTSAADTVLKEIESQWPEWDRPYLVHGLLLEHWQPAEAKRKLQTAAALGSTDLALRCAMARLTPAASADSRCSCAGGLNELLFSRCAQQ